METRFDDPVGRDGAIALAAGPIIALAVAGLLSPLRNEIGTTNVALVLAGIVVAAALAGRVAGFATAFTAAIGFNFFHTVPYHSLRISGHRDIITVCLLATIGMVVSELGAWRRRALASSRRRQHSAQMLEEAIRLLAGGADTETLWAAIRTDLVESLDLADCRYEAGPTTLQTVGRSGSIVSSTMHIVHGGFELPTDGAAIPVLAAGSALGHIVLVPKPHVGTTIDMRRAAVALADLYAVALTATPARGSGVPAQQVALPRQHQGAGHHA